MITGAAQMDRRDPGRGSHRWTDAERGSTFCGAASGVPAVSFSEKCDMVEDAELLELVELKFRRIAEKLPVSGRFDCCREGSALQAAERRREVGKRRS